MGGLIGVSDMLLTRMWRALLSFFQVRPAVKTSGATTDRFRYQLPLLFWTKVVLPALIIGCFCFTL